MKLLVTGGLGNLGLWFVEHFLAKGWEVTALGRSEKISIDKKDYDFIEVDIADRIALVASINCYYDFCIHTASARDCGADNYAEVALSVNVLGTDNLCHALTRSGVGRLIYISTFHVYGAESGVVSESSQILPKSDYGLTHYFAEQVIEKNSRTTGLEYCIFRLTNSYGCPKSYQSGNWKLLLNDLCRAASVSGEIKLKGVGSVSRDFIWMGDVVEVVEKTFMHEQFINSCFNLSSGMTLQIREIACRVARVYKEIFGEAVKSNLAFPVEVASAKNMSVKNTKLLSSIEHCFEDRIDQEAEKIIRLVSRTGCIGD